MLFDFCNKPHLGISHVASAIQHHITALSLPCTAGQARPRSRQDRAQQTALLHCRPMTGTPCNPQSPEDGQCFLPNLIKSISLIIATSQALHPEARGAEKKMAEGRKNRVPTSSSCLKQPDSFTALPCSAQRAGNLRSPERATVPAGTQSHAAQRARAEQWLLGRSSRIANSRRTLQGASATRSAALGTVGRIQVKRAQLCQPCQAAPAVPRRAELSPPPQPASAIPSTSRAPTSAAPGDTAASPP